MRSRRPRTAATLVVLGILLLAGIAVGQRIGERALFGSTERRSPVVAPIATPVPETTADPQISRNWKRLQVVSVATDPAFPDPRVTRPPTPTPSPRPTPSPEPPPPALFYTSPPLPFPLASPAPNAPTDTPPVRPNLAPGIRYEQ